MAEIADLEQLDEYQALVDAEQEIDSVEALVTATQESDPDLAAIYSTVEEELRQKARQLAAEGRLQETMAEIVGPLIVVAIAGRVYN